MKKYRFPSASREQPNHRLCTSLQTAGNRGNTARGVPIPGKPVWNMPLPLSTKSPATSTRPQELSQPLHVENREILPKVTLDDA